MLGFKFYHYPRNSGFSTERLQVPDTSFEPIPGDLRTPKELFEQRTNHAEVTQQGRRQKISAMRFEEWSKKRLALLRSQAAERRQ